MNNSTKILFIFVLLSSGCSRNGKLPAPLGGEKRFTTVLFQKAFEKSTRYCRWWIPIPEGYLAQQVAEKNESEYNLIAFDNMGNEIRRGSVIHGQGPTDILGVHPETVSISADGKKVLFVDGVDFYKEVDLTTLKVNTKFRLSDKIPLYNSKYVLDWAMLDSNNGQTVISLASTGYRVDRTYYLAIYSGEFSDFRIIGSLNKGIPEWVVRQSRSNWAVDFYNRLRWQQSFTVDWVRKTIYAIPDIERPEIERIFFNGQKDRISLDFSGPLKICNEDFNRFFQWNDENLDQNMKRLFKFIYRRPVHAPPLMGLKVINDWLLVITGNRDGYLKCNETLVYRLPSLKLEGSMWLPFPAMIDLSLRWGDGYYYYYSEPDIEDRQAVLFYRYKPL